MDGNKPIPWSNTGVHTFLCLLADEKIQMELDGARNEKVFRELSEQMASRGYQRTPKQCREKLKKLKSDYRAIKEQNGQNGTKRKNWKWFDQMDSIYGNRPTSNGRENGRDSAAATLDSMMDEEFLSVFDGSPSTSLLDPPSSPPSAAPSATPPAAPSAAPSAPPPTTPIPAPEQPSATPQHAVPLKRKRPSNTSLSSFFTEMQNEDALNRAQREEHMQLLLREAREAREHEASLAREAAEQAATLAREAAERSDSLVREEMEQNAAFNKAFLAVLGDLVRAVRDRPTHPS